jgi:hypothetical protein
MYYTHIHTHKHTHTERYYKPGEGKASVTDVSLDLVKENKTLKAPILKSTLVSPPLSSTTLSSRKRHSRHFSILKSNLYSLVRLYTTADNGWATQVLSTLYWDFTCLSLYTDVKYSLLRLCMSMCQVSERRWGLAGVLRRFWVVPNPEIGFRPPDPHVKSV